MRTDRRRSATLLVAALLLAGCTTAAPERIDHQPRRPVTPTATSQEAAPESSLEASFRELAETIPATVGIAIAPVGGTTVAAFGSWSTGVAWSTIKVPLAIAALRADRVRAEDLAARAITRSDNAAAEQLWSQLGAPDQAAQKVRSVIEEDGDSTTVVESRRLRPGFTAFGQTQWTLGRQAQFAAHLPCIPDSSTVVDLMDHLVGEQRWGLAAAGAASKGGWGPGEARGYLVRQLGVLSTLSGELGVALAADAATFDAGVDALNRMTQWLTTHMAELPGGRCTPPS